MIELQLQKLWIPHRDTPAHMKKTQNLTPSEDKHINAQPDSAHNKEIKSKT